MSTEARVPPPPAPPCLRAHAMRPTAVTVTVGEGGKRGEGGGISGRAGGSGREGEGAGEGDKTPYVGKYSADSAQLAAAEHLDVDEEVITSMRNLFERFCRFGEAEGSYSVDEMRDFIFLKLCRDCNLLDSRVTEKGAK